MKILQLESVFSSRTVSYFDYKYMLHMLIANMISYVYSMCVIDQKIMSLFKEKYVDMQK